MQKKNPIAATPCARALAWCYAQVRAVRPGRALAVTLILILAAETQVRRLENFPDLVLRNEGHRQDALPYMLMRMKRVDPSVAFIGASVMQGLATTKPEETAPVLIEKRLREEGAAATCFNMASMGAQMGDHFAVTSAAIRNGADALVVSIHYKLFSSHSMFDNPMRYSQLAFYLRTEPDIGELLGKFRISPADWMAIRVRGNVANVWGLYRYRGLITQLVTGSPHNPLVQLEDAWADRLGVVIESDPGRNIIRTLEKKNRNREDIWQDMLPQHHESEREVFSQMEINRYNIHGRMLVKLVKAAEEARVPLLLYYTPQNRELIDREKYFIWDNFAHFKKKIEAAVGDSPAEIVDLTDAVPAAYFTDADHITKKGHAVLAEALYPHVRALVERAEEREP